MKTYISALYPFNGKIFRVTPAFMEREGGFLCSRYFKDSVSNSVLFPPNNPYELNTSVFSYQWIGSLYRRCLCEDPEFKDEVPSDNTFTLSPTKIGIGTWAENKGYKYLEPYGAAVDGKIISDSYYCSNARHGYYSSFSPAMKEVWFGNAIDSYNDSFPVFNYVGSYGIEFGGSTLRNVGSYSMKYESGTYSNEGTSKGSYIWNKCKVVDFKKDVDLNLVTHVHMSVTSSLPYSEIVRAFYENNQPQILQHNVLLRKCPVKSNDSFYDVSGLTLLSYSTRGYGLGGSSSFRLIKSNGNTHEFVITIYSGYHHTKPSDAISPGEQHKYCIGDIGIYTQFANVMTSPATFKIIDYVTHFYDYNTSNNWSL